jgi:hypothetical protein
MPFVCVSLHAFINAPMGSESGTFLSSGRIVARLHRKRLGLSSEAHSTFIAEAFPMLANGNPTGTRNLAVR